ncbi:MAG: DUF1007 family protein [Sulfitobacter sp.]
MKHFISALLCLICASPLAAHPHIFVDTGLDLRFGADGRLQEVRVTWAYDEFYSLLIMEDRSLDPDFDGVLTEAEQADLTGFDMQWTPGFNGDLVITQGGQTLALSGPAQATARYEDGRITTTHVRRISAHAAGGAPVEIRPYDATYYTAYDITLPVNIQGTENCRKSFDLPDIDARLMEVRDQLNAMDTVMMSDDADLPDIGILLATTVIVTCDAS